MIQFEELKLELLSYSDKLKDLREALGLDKVLAEIAELEAQTATEGFWNDIDNSQKVQRRIAQLKNKVGAYEALKGHFDDTLIMIELSDEEEDLDLLEECKQGVASFIRDLDAQTLSTLLTGEYDSHNAILTFHAGAGGTEAQDWVSMLYRMYVRYCERAGYTVKELDLLEGDEAGIKSVTFECDGENAYGYLKAEKGVHRLVRISPFDSSGRRHTSFASLDVTPILDDDSSAIEINPDDIRVDTYRSSGAGGQHVNKTSSAIRITHFPTGVVVQCQNERSQIQNRETAMRMLRGKLLEIKERERMEHMADIKGEMKKIEWGSQIRSYVFQPYTMVKDHRTGEETGNIQAVMDGEIDNFINAFLMKS